MKNATEKITFQEYKRTRAIQTNLIPRNSQKGKYTQHNILSQREERAMVKNEKVQVKEKYTKQRTRKPAARQKTV